MSKKIIPIFVVCLFAGGLIIFESRLENDFGMWAVQSVRRPIRIPPKETITPPVQTFSATTSAVQITPSQIYTHPPFTSQAPRADWDNPVFQDACEETASLMAVYWALGKNIPSADFAQQEIMRIAAYQADNFGDYRDTSAQDTLTRIINGYFAYSQARFYQNITLQDIIDQLTAGRLVIVPTDGQKLSNPYYTPPGPHRHNLLIYKYNPSDQTFTTHDPGTKRGEAYVYDQQVLFTAIRDYSTGFHQPFQDIQKNMIVIEK